MKNVKVVTIVGTRPELIRLSRVIAALNDYTDHVLVHTGQNYDYELNQVFFDELELLAPDYFLGVAVSSLGKMLGNILIETEQVLLKEEPDAVLILGDTNSAIAAIMARRMKIPVYHMEAGNRCFDFNVPEETNRRLVDHISDFNLVYTEHARRHLLSEGLPHRRIYLTGSPMKEVLDHYAASIDQSEILVELELTESKYFLVSMHREENVDNSENLGELLGALRLLADEFDFPVVVSTHPRTRDRMERFGEQVDDPRIRFLKPFGFFAYNKLQKSAACVLSDSGTITEESTLLGFPAVTIREAMERPEGLDTGSIILTGVQQDVVLQAVRAVMQQHKNEQVPPVPDDYMVENVSQRVVNLIIGTARLSNQWDGIKVHDFPQRES
jgi:UDP-N-acetylglucosamine 2-epimerase (non-hydrolysing)